MSTMLFSSLLLLFSGIYFEVACLQCWECRSDGINSSFCGDYFDKDLITDQQRSYVYTNCSIVKPNQTNPLTVPIIPVCRVLRQIENATTIVYRGCHYQQDGVPRDCRHTDNPKGIRTVYCMTCSTDGCNAALDFDLLKKSLLANTAITMSDSMNVSLIFVLLFNWLL